MSGAYQEALRLADADAAVGALAALLVNARAGGLVVSHLKPLPDGQHAR